MRFEAGFEKLRDRYTGALGGCWSIGRCRSWCMGGADCDFALPGARSWGGISFRRLTRGSSGCTCGRRPGTRVEDDRGAVLRRGADHPEGGAGRGNPHRLDNIGLPVSGINLAFSDNATIGEADGEILVALNENHHPTAGLCADAADDA